MKCSISTHALPIRVIVMYFNILEVEDANYIGHYVLFMRIVADNVQEETIAMYTTGNILDSE